MRFAYLVDGKDLDIKNVKGIINKLKFLFWQHSKNFKMCKVSDIYDNRLVNIGDLVALWNPDKINDMNSLFMGEFFSENDIRYICCGDIHLRSELLPKSELLHFYDGKKYRFIKNTDTLILNASLEDEYMIIISETCSLDDIAPIVKGLRYINLFCEFDAVLHEIAKVLYDNEGIVVGQTNSPRDILLSKCKIVLQDETFFLKYTEIAERIQCIDLYSPTTEKHKAYSAVLGEFYMNDTYSEFLFCSKND